MKTILEVTKTCGEQVENGDELPYIAKHQFNTSISLEHNKFELHLNGRQNGAFRTVAGTEKINENNGITSNFIVDFSGKYHIKNNLSITGMVLNMFDTTYAVSKVPAGLDLVILLESMAELSSVSSDILKIILRPHCARFQKQAH